MDWLNLHTSVLDSEDFLGCEPVDQATWLKLMRYCIGQENGGVIATDPEWGDRRWQQVFRVTIKESRRICALWHWDGAMLHVHFYPMDKQEEVQAKRSGNRSGGKARTQAKTEAARINGAKGGRPKTQVETQVEPNTNPTEGKGREEEGKGREEEGKGREENAQTAVDRAVDSQIEDIMESDRQTLQKVAATPPVYSWIDWRREHPRIGVARTGEDGDLAAWKDLWSTYGREIMDAMYGRLSQGLAADKRIWFTQAADWIAKNTKEVV